MASYFFICLAVGVLGFSVVAVAALVFRDGFTRAFFGFHAAYTFLMAASTLVLGAGPGGMAGFGPSLGPTGFRMALLALAVANGAFLAALPGFADHLRNTSSPSRRIAWSSLGIICCLLLALTIEPRPATYEFNLPIPVAVAVQAAFVAALAYSFRGIGRRARSDDGSLELRFARRFNRAALVFLPGVVLDAALSPILPFRFFPILYALTTMFFVGALVDFIRSALNPERARQPSATHPGPVVPTAELDRLGLTTREREVAALLLSGLGNRAIAYQLCVSMPTVKTHTQNIYRKAGVNGRFELVRLANARLQLDGDTDAGGRQA